MTPEATPTRDESLPLGLAPGQGAGGLAALRRHPLFITFYLGCLASLGPLAIDMYLPAFPRIAAGLSTDVASIQRTLSAYFIGIALGQLAYGPISDRIGRKWPLYIGLGIFALASVGCALAWDAHSLMVMRVFQALGGCAEMVIARAIVKDLFDDRQSARVFSQLVLVMGVAPVVAPMMGGFLAVHFGWRSIFWALMAASMLLLFTTAFLLDESLPPQRRLKHSFSGIISTHTGLLRERVFMTYNLIAALGVTGLFAYVGGSSYVFQEIYHISEERFFIFFGPMAAGLIGMAQVNGYLVYRMSIRVILRAALTASTLAGVTLLVAALTGFGGFWGIYIPLWCFMASLGFVFGNATVLAMSGHGKIAGNASALVGFTQFGMAAIGGVIVSALQNHSAVPMAGMIALCAVAALALNLTVPLKVPAAQPNT